GTGFGSCKLAPLTQKPVQQELKLSRDQLKKLQTFQVKQQQEVLRRLGGLQPGSLLQKSQKPDEIGKELEGLAKEAEKAVADILTPGQGKRLREISLQQRGGNALADADVAAALQLTDEQRQRVRTIQEEATKEAQA